MLSFHYLPLLLPFTLAWPVTTQQDYDAALPQLREDLQRLWYSDDTGGSSEQLKQASFDTAAAYSCVGPTSEDFPAKDKWLSFDQLWEINEPAIEEVNGGTTYNDALRTAIEEVSSASKVDARLILIMIMQESTGNVSIHCTEGTACGIMQHRGSPEFDASDPEQSIKSMIEAGIYGASDVPGYLAYFNGDSYLTWVNTQLINGNPYAAAHVYNTGHIDTENLSTDRGSSNYYAHDILSRLQGWNGWKAGCLESRQCPGLGFGDRNCH